VATRIFGHREMGNFARYMAGRFLAVEAGDMKLAEQNLSEASSFRDRDLFRAGKICAGNPSIAIRSATLMLSASTRN